MFTSLIRVFFVIIQRVARLTAGQCGEKTFGLGRESPS